MENVFTLEKKASLTLPLYFSFLFPIAIGLLGLFGLFHAVFERPLYCFLFFLMAFLPTIRAVKAFSDHISSGKPFFKTFFREFTLIPAWYIYGSDLKKDAIPWVTLSLITANIFIFFFVPERSVDHWTFVPYGNPSALLVFLSMFTCTFLHAGPAHLFGNMLFLWAFGSVVEPRIGSARFLYLYIACILTSGVLVAVFLLLKASFPSSTFNPGTFHSLGASGAIAGIMGIFVVRCYFSRLKYSIPFLFFPILSLPTKVNASVLLGIFFAFDLAGSVSQFNANSGINYWAHVGGYAGGFLMAYMLKLNRDASREAVKVKAERMSTKPLGKKEAARRYREILQEEPENEKALHYLFAFHRYNREKRGHYFERLLEVLLNRDFFQALELFEDHFPTLIKDLSGKVLLRFGLHYYKVGDLDKAWPCLELAAVKKGSWQAKALYTLGMTYEEMGRDALARKMFEKVVEKFPNSAFEKSALEKLE